MSKTQVIIFCAGLLLFTPSLWAGFILDDYYYLGAIEGRFPEHDTRRSLFPFFINNEDANRAVIQRGGHPWWIDERIKGETLRPLSELLFRADHAIYGKNAFGYHLHSLAWWTAALLACALLFRRVLPGVAGTVAFLLFAVDDVHVMPVAWLSNRNALVALVPMIFGLWAWMRWREDGWSPGWILAPLGVVIGMAGSELGLAMLGYFFAYALLGAPAASARVRLTRLAPVAVLAAAYAVIYRFLGYGGSGSGVYHEPLRDPLGYLQAAATGIPTLLAGGIAGFSADFWFINPSLRTAQVVGGCAAVLVLFGLLRACWPQLDEPTRRGLRWLLAGSALSLFPVAAVFPADRMLLVPGIGLAAGLAVVLVSAFRAWRVRRGWFLIGAGGFLALVHLLLAPLLTVYIQAALIKSGRSAVDLAASPVVAAAGGKETVVIFAPDSVVGIYLPVMIAHLDGPRPKSWRPLSIAPYDHTLRRTGPRTLELEVEGGGVMLRSVFEELYREPTQKLFPGAVVDRGLLRAEIMAADDRGPTRIAFQFDRDLTDPGLYFLVWRDGRLRAAELPGVGEEVFLKRTMGPGGF